MMKAIQDINKRIQSLAPVLFSSDCPVKVTILPDKNKGPVDVLVKEHDGKQYLFSINMHPEATSATIFIEGLPYSTQIEVIDQNRSLISSTGRFVDHFEGYQLNIYKFLSYNNRP